MPTPNLSLATGSRPAALDAFRQLRDGKADSTDRRVVVDAKGSPVIVEAGETGMIARLLKADDGSRNKQACAAFYDALAQDFGGKVANRVFNKQLRDGDLPLTPALLQKTINAAERDQELNDSMARGEVMARAPDLASLKAASSQLGPALSPGHVPAERSDVKREVVLSPSVADSKHSRVVPTASRYVSLRPGEVGDFGQVKLLARMEALSRRSGAVEAQDEIARGALSACEAGGALEIDRTAQQIRDGAQAAESADATAAKLTHKTLEGAIKGMDSVTRARSGVYAGFVENALLAVAHQVMRADRRPGCPTLQGLARWLCEAMDVHVSSMMVRFKGKNYAEVAAALSSNPLATLAEYPRLLHGMDTEMVCFARNVHTVLNRVEVDREAIGETFLGVKDPGDVVGITITGSDPHHGGQRVMILRFAAKPDEPVVYKPRDCRVDATFMGEPGVGHVTTQTLAGVINDAMKRPVIGTCRFLLGGAKHDAYGFMQFVHSADKLPAGSDNVQGLEKLYEAYGALLGASIPVGATDLHHGNVFINAKDGLPVVTDAEMLLSRDVLGVAPLEAGALPHARVGSTGLDQALTKINDPVHTTPIAVEADGRITQAIIYSKKEATRNFVTFEGRPITVNDPQLGETLKKAVHSGFNQVMTVLSDPAVSERVSSVLRQFEGMHVRFHPVGTHEQLQILEIHRQQADRPPACDLVPGFDRRPAYLRPDVPSQRPGGEADPLRALMAPMQADFTNGDVAYFSRVVGDTERLYHHDREGAHEIEGLTATNYDALGQAVAVVGAISTRPEFRADLQRQLETMLPLSKKAAKDTKGAPDG